MSDEEEKGRELAEVLRRALSLQARGTLHLAVLAASATGSGVLSLRGKLAEFATAGLGDIQRLVEQAQALGVLDDLEIATVPVGGSTSERLQRLIDDEEEAIRALHAVIPHAGEEARSEAIEHLMEHLLLRKQQQVDLLRRVLTE